MIGYLEKLHRPVGADPSEHADRMRTLVRYTNKLPGTKPDIDDDLLKEMIFDSLPEGWKTDYVKHHDIDNETIEDIITFMKRSKNIQDSEDNKNNKRKNGNGNGWQNKKKMKTGDHKNDMDPTRIASSTQENINGNIVSTINLV